MEAYKTLAAPATGRYEEKKSVFVALAAPAACEEEALRVLEEQGAAHRGARHHVYAYLLREGARQRYSDDGEPAKTAGLPVLGALTHAGLSDCVLVVSRYFGGTLLGTGGLVRAYGSAAEAAIGAADILTMQACVRLCLTVAYPLFESARRLLVEAGARLDAIDYADSVHVKATLAAGGERAVLEKLAELSRGALNATVGEAFYAAL